MLNPGRRKEYSGTPTAFSSINTTADNQLKVDVGGYNAVIGKSYGEIAALSRSQHKKPWGFEWPQAGVPNSNIFRILMVVRTKKSLMEGVNTGWSRIGASKISASIETIIKNYSLSNPSLSVPSLIKLYKEISSLPNFLIGVLLSCATCKKLSYLPVVSGSRPIL